MSLTLTIAGTDRTNKLYLPDSPGAIDAFLAAGSKGSLRLQIYDKLGAAGYRADNDQTITLQDGATVVFAGVIDHIDETGLTDLDRGILMTVTASDWHDFCGRLWYTGSFNAGTSLRDVLTVLIADSGLDDYGVTLDAGAMGAIYPNGPLMPATVTFDCYTEAALNKLRQLTGFVWRITTAKVLKMQEPAWVSCGYSLGDADLGGVIGKVASSKSRATGSYNRVRVTAGPSGPGEPIAQTWHGNGVATVFALLGLNVPASNARPGVVVIDGVTFPLFPVGTTGGNGIEWDWETNDGTIAFLGSFTVYATGATNIVVTYTPLYPFTVIRKNDADITARGIHDSPRVTVPEVLLYAEAVAVGDAIVRTGVANPTEVVVRTSKGIAYPGQSVALSFTERNISGTFLIAAVELSSTEAGALEYTLTCLSGTELKESWIDYYKTSDTASGGGTTVVVVGGGSGGTTTMTSSVFLGGARKNLVVAPTGATENDRWTPVPNYLPFIAPQSMGMLNRAFVAAVKAGIAVKVRLYDETAAAAVAGSTSAAITSTTTTEVSALIAVIAGHRYRQEIVNSVSGEGISGLGQLEGL